MGVVVTLGVVVVWGNVDSDALNVEAVGNDVVIFVVDGIPVVSMTAYIRIDTKLRDQLLFHVLSRFLP